MAWYSYTKPSIKQIQKYPNEADEQWLSLRGITWTLSTIMYVETLFYFLTRLMSQMILEFVKRRNDSWLVKAMRLWWNVYWLIKTPYCCNLLMFPWPINVFKHVFIRLILFQVKLFNEKRSDLEEQQLHLNVGLNKIRETVEQVNNRPPILILSLFFLFVLFFFIIVLFFFLSWFSRSFRPGASTEYDSSISCINSLGSIKTYGFERLS